MRYVIRADIADIDSKLSEQFTIVHYGSNIIFIEFTNEDYLYLKLKYNVSTYYSSLVPAMCLYNLSKPLIEILKELRPDNE